MNYSKMFPHKPTYSVYRPAYHRIPSTVIKESSPEMVSAIVVPSMSNITHNQPYAYNMYYKQLSIPIHSTLENATITYDTKVEHQKDLVKDVFFSPAMNDREMSPSVASTDEDDDDISLSPSEFLPLEEENLFDFGLEVLDKKPEPTSSKRRWSESVLQQSKRQKQDDFYFSSQDSFEEEADEQDTESEESAWDSEEEYIEEDAQFTRNFRSEADTINDEYSHCPQAEPRPTTYPTIYQKLTKANIDWCRYCGTTEGVNWRPGPWGKRTLCNKHGCDYKGYGFACKLPRLDLTAFVKESIDQRDRPVLQLYCSGCQRKDSWEGNILIRCEGCPKAYHQQCCPDKLTNDWIASSEAWFCNQTCCENSTRKRIIVELPRKRLPLMCAPSKGSIVEKR